MPNVMQLMPSLENDEMVYVQGLVKDFSDNQAQQFANIYNSRRKDPQTILLTAILGFVVVAGVHRFILGQIGMGLLYLFTVGLCLIGTIVDLVNHKKLALDGQFECRSTGRNDGESIELKRRGIDLPGDIGVHNDLVVFAIPFVPLIVAGQTTFPSLSEASQVSLRCNEGGER